MQTTTNYTNIERGTTVKTEGGGIGRYVGTSKTGRVWIFYPETARVSWEFTCKAFDKRFAPGQPEPATAPTPAPYARNLPRTVKITAGCHDALDDALCLAADNGHELRAWLKATVLYADSDALEHLADDLDRKADDILTDGYTAENSIKDVNPAFADRNDKNMASARRRWANNLRAAANR